MEADCIFSTRKV